jgi:hypothetical protein
MFGHGLGPVSFGSLHHISQAGTRETRISSTVGRQLHKLDGPERDTVGVQGDCPLCGFSLRAIENGVMRSSFAAKVLHLALIVRKTPLDHHR